MSLNIAIIPARGGSKRLPNKNIRLLGGKPLIFWTIDAAIKSNIFDVVFVSTDNQTISDISLRAGACVPFLRPEHLATDEATTNDVITHMVQWVEVTYGNVSEITLLQPTSPLRNENHIIEAHQLFKDKNAEVVVSVCELDHPIAYCNKLPADDSLDGFITESNNKRGQELEKYYRINGAIYIFDRKFVGNLSKIYGEKSYAYKMEKNCSVDIDDEYDFDFTKFLMDSKR